MADYLIVSNFKENIRIAYLKNDKLYQFFYESSHLLNPILNNIYWGHVLHITPSFIWIDIGEKEPGVLKTTNTTKKLFEGQKILVQVNREVIEDTAHYNKQKGVRLTQSINLAGKYCIYNPKQLKHIFSQSLEEATIKDLQEHLKNYNEYFTFRSHCQNVVNKQLILDEMDQLRNEWFYINSVIPSKNGLVKAGLNSIEKLVRDIYLDITIICEDFQSLTYLRSVINKYNPALISQMRIALENEKPLFEHFGIEDLWENLTEKSIPLKNNSNIYIETTACITSIDINGENSPYINKQAIPIIAQQIKLRELSGNIIIDFIWHSTAQKKEIIKDLQHELDKYQLNHIKINGWSSLGFLELQSPRLRSSLPWRIRQG